MEWFSWTVAVILLISSIVSPWLVTWFNNRHQLNLKKLDMFEDSKRNALSEFIKVASDIHFANTQHSQDEYYRALNCLYIYFKHVPSDISLLFDKRHSNDFFNELTNIVQVLSKQILKE